ncbi:MAG TPA: PTS sugar transporter subunit IIC [Firmicutes bacterium]|nr:PTS sugar transporter subunit IIC [Bacillota bacterium]
MAFMDKYIVPIAVKIGAQRHLVAVRDAFIAMIPVTMIGAFATLINNLPSDGYKAFMANVFGEGWTQLGGDIWWGTIATMALFVAVSVPYFLAKSYKEDGLQAGMISLCIFLLAAPQVGGEAWGNINWFYTGTSALFTAIIIGLLSGEVYVKLSRIKQITIKMPDGVPPAVARSFAKLIPGILTILIFAIVSMLIRFAADGQFITDLINTYLAAPLRNVADSLGGALSIAFFVHILWVFGLHGSNIALGITKPLTMDLGSYNATLAQQGATDGYHVMAGAFFDAFVYMGGAGLCIGLIIALMIAGRRRKDMIALGTLPACFNINEPIIFGLPIVMNPVFMIPFILAPLVATVVSYLAIQWGWVPPVIMPEIPWVTPPIFGGAMAVGHWSGGVLSFVNILISVVIYLPFVALSERIDLKRAQEEASAK